MRFYDFLIKTYQTFKKSKKITRRIISCGLIVFVFLILSGLYLIIRYNSNIPFHFLFEIGKHLVKTSFSVLAVCVIGGIIFDYSFSK